MSIAVAVNQVDFTASRLRVEVTLTTSGTYATGGVVIDFTAAGIDIPSSSPPVEASFHEVTATASTSASGSDYFFNPGTTQANGYMQIFKGGTEQTNATAFPSVSITATFWFPSL